MSTYLKKKNKLFIPLCLKEVLISLTKIAAKPILVGGCVRDHLLNLPIKDYDIEVFNIDSFESLEKHLKPFGKVQIVGKSFGVLKLQIDEFEFDFSLPRIEKKVALGHQGFTVFLNSSLSYKEAAIRRDFTINSIAYDYFEDSYLDPFNGFDALENKELRFINKNTFVEDPLRVYRAVQFVARFEFNLDKKTSTLCKEMVENNKCLELSKNRIYVEFEKLFLKSNKPSLGIRLLRDLGILKHYKMFEDIAFNNEKLWKNTLNALDEMVKEKTFDDKKDMILFWSILCHGLNKDNIINKEINLLKDRTLTSDSTSLFLKTLSDDKKMIEEVSTLVKYNQHILSLSLDNNLIKELKKLAVKVNIDTLIKISSVYCLGKGINKKNKVFDNMLYIKAKAKKLNINNKALNPLVLGRDLMNLGFKPGSLFKEILAFSYALQIEEDLSKEKLLDSIKKQFNN